MSDDYWTVQDMNDDQWLDPLDQPEPVYWKPEVGDRVVGQVIEFGTDQGNYEPYETLLLDTDDGPVLVALRHKVLCSLLDREDPLRVGDKFGAIRVDPPPGKEYRNYRIAIKRTARPGPARPGHGTSSSGPPAIQ